MPHQPLIEGNPLPLLVTPDGDCPGEAGLEAWVDERRDWIESQLVAHGGLLFRDLGIESPETFQRFCARFGSELRRYVGGDSPRKAVTDRVYTSTEYPNALEIPLHNEMSYAASWPAKIFFFCVQPAARGGETPIADGRKVLAAMPAEVLERFGERGVRYVQNLHGGWGMGKSWQQTFETEDRAAVEHHCRDSGIEFRWDGDALWLCQERPGVIEHPGTGERVWFNQANLWHVSSLGSRRRKALLHVMQESELPQHAYFGDGSPIDDADLEAVREALGRCTVSFPWREHDLLMLDNVLVAHGRRPFEGPRRLLTAMA